MPLRISRLFILSGLAALVACDPNVVIGAKWGAQAGSTGEPVEPGVPAFGGMAGGGTGSESVTAGASAAGYGGGGPEPLGVWCATAPWLDEPVTFAGESGTIIPAGNYQLTYEGGAQIHDRSLGYEVTDHYFGRDSLEAGHHVYSGDAPETGVTSLWLEDDALSNGDSVAAVEAANRGYSWPLQHAGGELHIALYDDYFGDNSGPGTELCLTAAALP